MNRQRGFLGLAMGQLILYGALAVGAVVLLAMVNSWLKSHYTADYVPLMAACTEANNGKKLSPSGCAAGIRFLVTDKTTCIAANKSLDEQFTTFRNVHNAQIEAARLASVQQKATRAAAEKAAAPRIAQNSMELFNMVVALGKPDGGLSCDQLDAALLETARQRQKFYGPATAPTTPAGALNIREPAPKAVTPDRPPPTNPLRSPK